MHILIVEDNQGDVFLMTESLEEHELTSQLTVMKNGKDAIDFLQQCDEEEPNGLPDLIFLDINLPKKNGHEVLGFIKNNARIKYIPVVILTTSSSKMDIEACYRNHANCFITKPIEAERFQCVFSEVVSFWDSVVTLCSNN